MSTSELEFDYEEYDDDFDEEYGDSISSPGSLEGGLSEENEVEFEPWDLPSFIQVYFLEKVKQLKDLNLSACSENDILIMLESEKWDVDKILNRIFDDKHALYKQCGLVEVANNRFEQVVEFDCSICCETYPKVQIYSLTCDHKFCVNCYQEYVKHSLYKEGPIRCIDPECDLSIPHRDAQKLLKVNSPDAFETPLKLNSLLVESAKFYINSRKMNLKWCPVPDCNSLCQLVKGKDDIKDNDLDLTKVPIVLCAVGHQFCYACQYENHLPCPCWLVKKWIKKCADDSETLNWIQAHTQVCPKCALSIEKNGGCNHMRCSNCRHEFCWICMKDWELHGTSFYKCNNLEPSENNVEEIKLKNSKRLSLQRYLHFFKRFAVHESSMHADLQTLEKVDVKMKRYMDTMSATGNVKNLSWVDIQYLHDAVKSLTNGRKTLKWTYCFAYYLSSSNFSEIFEQNQEFLSKLVEDLSEIFEKINDKNNKNDIQVLQDNKAKMINLSKLISLRQQTVIDSATSELNQGLLRIET